MINKVILVGNLGRDPEIRSTNSGMPVANFSIATNRRWKDRDGNRQEQTEWHNVVCFGRQAEVAGQYLTRGRPDLCRRTAANSILGRQTERRDQVPHGSDL